MLDVLRANLPYLLKGAGYTVALASVTISLGLVTGVGLGIVSALAPKPLRLVVAAYVFVVRGLPVLIVVFLFYYVPPAFGLELDTYVAAGFALVCYGAAFVAEITRGAIEATPRGQIDAARSLGLRWPVTLRLIVLPQALRFSAAPLLNNTIMSIKVTSYASVVGAWELTYAAREVVERTLAAFEIFAGVMLIYFVLCFPLSLIADGIERRVAGPIRGPLG